ncbi:3297_t:CDS:2 [Acaulospora colombiana]|uniref:3297_t:CDS:1 n=1 Tax=Acaulospora colombiana TaxID=27376 RepID=A0ACA9MPI1_9GLOM|nr:3297_t:CDS:2 [Acaulospora colombiana]
MLPSLLPFERLHVTVLVIACYLAVIISTVVVQERLPRAPSRRGKPGLNLDEAWSDLQEIAQVPHPFNSHTNDEVGLYIAGRLQNIQGENDFITLDLKPTTNASWYMPQDSSVTYVESRNLAIKFEGSKYNDSAILLTAHYDTSALAPGATDDSIAVASLLQTADYLANNQPERTIIILFDNGEENGRHVRSFINLEGAGCGGRPNLFRASSPQITRAFASTTHPHGSSLASDAFSLGLIRSATDFSIYQDAGIAGADYAFYMRRQKYHTMEDNIPNLRNRRSLWSMMENLYYVVEVIANQPDSQESDATRFVYFDSESGLSGYFPSLTASNMFVILLGHSLHKSKKLYLGWRGWGRFPAALAIGILGGAICAGLITEWNPMVASIFCFAALGLLLPLYLADWWRPVSIQRAQVLVELLVFWWVLSAINLVLMGRNALSGAYFITFFYAATLATTIVTLLDMHRLNRKSATEVTPLIPRAEELLATHRLGDDQLGWIWTLEFILLAVFPAILMLQILFALLAALGPTVTDGSKPSMVYIIITGSILLTLLPITPFAHKLHPSVFAALLLLGIATTAYSSLEFPFTPENSFKTLYWQSADLNAGNSTITLLGVRPYLQRVLKQVGSIDYDKVEWRKANISGLAEAKFTGLVPRSVPDEKMSNWVNVTLERSSPSSVLLRISGVDTRACRLYFDGGYNVSQVVVRGQNTDGYDLPSSFPIKTVNLWSRSWSRTWEVDIELAALGSSETPSNANVLTGRASCVWSDRAKGKVPALDDLYVRFPTWATMTAWRGGLVEGWKSFSI